MRFQKDRIYVSLYMNGAAEVETPFGAVKIAQETRWPWDGAVALTVTPEKPSAFALLLRIPEWAQGRPVPSDLYHYANADAPAPRLSVNGQPAELALDKGYAVLRREWKPGDRVELAVDMRVRRVLANEAVEEDRGPRGAGARSDRLLRRRHRQRRPRASPCTCPTTPRLPPNSVPTCSTASR